MDLGPHAGFIVAAYLVATAIVVGLIGWVLADHRAQARSLADLESRGVTRRSDRSDPSAKVESGLRSENATMPPS